MDNPSFADARRHLRYDIMDFAMIYCPSHPDGVRALIVDLGLGGIAIRAKETIKPEEKIKIQIGKANAVPYELNGSVKYCEDSDSVSFNSIGIQFVPESHEERILIARLINEAFQRTCKENTA